MGLTRTLDTNKNNRRQSWISGSPLFNSIFSSSPPSNSVQRSHSMKEQANHWPQCMGRQHSLVIDRSIGPKEPQHTSHKKSSALATILYKAKHRQHRRSVTLDSVVIADEPKLHQQVQLLEKDDYEADKSQLKNDFMNLAFTEEFRSTVDFSKLKQGRILDVGCGSGAWCIEMAQKYPHLKVIGIDYENWFPEEVSSIPPNCRLIHGNILDSLKTQFERHSFDFIHIRLMALVLTATQYELASQYCWNLLKPGATMELLELDLKMCSAGPVTKKLNQQVIHVADHLGFQVNLATRLASFAPWNDCLNLQQKYQSLPIGLWGGRLGVLFRDDLVDVLRRCQASVCRHHAKPKDDKTFFAELGAARREMEQYHTYANFHFLTVNKRPTM